MQIRGRTAVQAMRADRGTEVASARISGVARHQMGPLASANGRNEKSQTTGDAAVANDIGRLQTIWKRVALRLRAEIGEDLYTSWFTRMEVFGLDVETVVMSVPTRFLRSWIQSHYRERLLKLWRSEIEEITDLEIRVRTVGTPMRPVVVRTETATSSRAPVEGEIEPPACASDLSAERGSPLDRAMTFETFVVGRSNGLAHAAASRVAEAEPRALVTFNPLYIHSPSGLGKTHLLQAIAWRVRTRTPSRRILYLTAERFMYHFVAAIKAKDMLAFKDFFQGVDVLLIDDFQFLQGRSMQQEFCHTFNSLVDSKRQVIIAGDLPPAQLESIDDRTRSRLAGGLVVDIEPAELDLRRAILKMRLDDARKRECTIDIDDDVLDYVANKIQSGGRELEGALTRIVANQQLVQVRMTVDMAAQALRDLVRPSDSRRIKIDDILRVVGRHYNVAKSDLLSPRRARSIVRPRQIGMYLAKAMTTRSLPEIGRRFGGRDHSTVLHAIRKIDELAKQDEKLAREIELLMRLLDQ